MRINIFCWVMIISFILSAPSIAGKMTAEKVIQNYMDNYEKQWKDVKDLTKVTNKGISYRKRITGKGKTIWKIRNETEVMGQKSISIYDGVYQWYKGPYGKVTKNEVGDITFQFEKGLQSVKAEAKYGGTENIDGHKCHILEIEDMTKVMSFPKKEMEGWEDVTASGKLWIDAKDWVIRKYEMDIKGVDEEGKKRTVKMTLEQENFRKDNGLLIPYRTVKTTGFPLTPEEEQKMQEIRKGLTEMQKQLEAMTPAQREMAEALMKPQVEKMQKFLHSGEITEITEVKDVKINTGLSDDLFDGSKLK